jgi:hypothetical protein
MSQSNVNLASKSTCPVESLGGPFPNEATRRGH